MATTNLVQLCKPAVKQSLGMLLEDMAVLFNIRYMEYAVCQNAEVALRTQAHAALPKATSHNRHSCAEESLESFSRSWATGFGGRCSSYESYFASALTRHSDAVRETRPMRRCATKEVAIKWLA